MGRSAHVGGHNLLGTSSDCSGGSCRLTCVVLMSAQRKQNLRIPSRLRITAFSDRNIECERCIGCDIRENRMPSVRASKMIPNSVCSAQSLQLLSEGSLPAAMLTGGSG